MKMLNQSFNSKPANVYGQNYREGGKTVTNPSQVLSLAMSQDAGMNRGLSAGPLAQALSQKAKKRKGLQ